VVDDADVRLPQMAPFPTGLQHMDSINCRNSDALAALLSNYGNIERVVCGHHHCIFLPSVGLFDYYLARIGVRGDAGRFRPLLSPRNASISVLLRRPGRQVQTGPSYSPLCTNSCSGPGEQT
jgi:hypothetical protein